MSLRFVTLKCGCELGFRFNACHCGSPTCNGTCRPARDYHYERELLEARCRRPALPEIKVRRQVVVRVTRVSDAADRVELACGHSTTIGQDDENYSLVGSETECAGCRL